MLRGFDVAVPKLKAALKGGALTLDGSDLATRGGRLSGNAKVDATQSTPYIETTFKADGIDVQELLEAVGVQAVLSGSSAVEATLTGSGSSQREIVETLSGTLKARIGRGDVIGYNLSSALGWFFSSREFDPDVRTPFNSLVANMALDNGVTRKSTVDLEGPSIGVDADGMTRLLTREIRYTGRFRIGPFLRGIPFKLFGSWNRPSFVPDMAGFNRSPQSFDNPLGALSEADLADPELADLTRRVVQKAGPRGLTSGIGEAVRALDLRLQSIRR